MTGRGKSSEGTFDSRGKGRKGFPRWFRRAIGRGQKAGKKKKGTSVLSLLFLFRPLPKRERNGIAADVMPRKNITDKDRGMAFAVLCVYGFCKNGGDKKQVQGKNGGARAFVVRSRNFPAFPPRSALRRKRRGKALSGGCFLTVCLRRFTAFSPPRGSKKRFIQKSFLKMRLNGVYFRRMQKKAA